MIKKKSLKDDIRNGTSLLEIIHENIDMHADQFANCYYVGVDRTKKEILKIVIENLNEALEKYGKRKK